MISLKTFHLFFIAMSIIITIWFAIYEYQLDENGFSIFLSFLSILCAIGLGVYGKKVYEIFKVLS